MVVRIERYFTLSRIEDDLSTFWWKTIFIPFWFFLIRAHQFPEYLYTLHFWFCFSRNHSYTFSCSILRCSRDLTIRLCIQSEKVSISLLFVVFENNILSLREKYNDEEIEAFVCKIICWSHEETILIRCLNIFERITSIFWFELVSGLFTCIPPTQVISRTLMHCALHIPLPWRYTNTQHKNQTNNCFMMLLLLPLFTIWGSEPCFKSDKPYFHSRDMYNIVDEIEECSCLCIYANCTSTGSKWATGQPSGYFFH